jgi:hypothetical protein
VTLEREHRPLDSAKLQWGIEKAAASGVKNVGTVKQAFVIETKR